MKRIEVHKLRAARDAKRKATGRCEGAKPYGSLPGEAATLAHIQQSRADGSTLQSIADALNKRKVPPRRGSKWHAKTIARIAARTGVRQAEEQCLLWPLLLGRNRKPSKESLEAAKAADKAKPESSKSDFMFGELVYFDPEPFIPFGYERAGGRKSDLMFGKLVKVGKKTETHGHRIVEMPEEQAIIRRIRYLHDVEGKRYREIAAMLDV